MIGRLLLAAAAAAMLGAAPAPAPPQVVVDQATRALIEASRNGDGEADLRGMFGRGPRRAPREMFSVVDINRDGRPDWRVDYEKSPNPSFSCGTGGCRQQLFVSLPKGGHRLAYDRLTRVMKIERRGGETILDLDFHGSTCGRSGVEPCPWRFAWSPAAGRFVERPSSEGTRLIGPLVNPLPLRLAAAPAPVRAEIAALEARCRRGGSNLEGPEGNIDSTPDLNGDGLRDWIVGGEYTWCTADSASPLGLTVLVSGPGGYTPAWRSAATRYRVDIAGRPAVLTIETPDEDCAAGRGRCPPVTLAWDAAAHTFKPR